MKPPVNFRRDLDDVLDEIAAAADRFLTEHDTAELTDGCAPTRAVLGVPASKVLKDLRGANEAARRVHHPRWSGLLLERTVRAIAAEDRTQLRAAVIDIAALAAAWVMDVDGGDDDEPASKGAAA